MKNNIQRLALLCFTALNVLVATAQEPGPPPPLSPERLQEMKAQRTAYITTKLGLTPDEAQRFWPVYNEYDDARERLRREVRDMHRSTKDKEGGITEAEAKQILAKVRSNRQQELDLEARYTDRFVSIIGAVKTVELHGAERDFQREVLRRYKQEERQGSPPGKR